MISVRLFVSANEHLTERCHTCAPTGSAPDGGSRNGLPERVIQIFDEQPSPSIAQADRFGRFGQRPVLIDRTQELDLPRPDREAVGEVDAESECYTRHTVLPNW